jgi:hypothetical protein
VPAEKRFAVQIAGTLMKQQPIPEAAVLDENSVVEGEFVRKH